MTLRDKNGLTEQEFLAQYKPSNYPRPSMTVDMLMLAASGLKEYMSLEEFEELNVKVLLIKRGGHPCLGQWALPGGFVNPNETVTQAAYRELEEETGVKSAPLTQLYTFSQPGRDPRTWVMSCAHIALLDIDAVKIQAGDDADKAAWFDLTFRIEEENNTSKFYLKLTNNEVSLSACVECPDGHFDESICRVIANDGLAFDHPKMLVCGLRKMLNTI